MFWVSRTTMFLTLKLWLNNYYFLLINFLLIFNIIVIIFLMLNPVIKIHFRIIIAIYYWYFVTISLVKFIIRLLYLWINFKMRWFRKSSINKIWIVSILMIICSSCIFYWLFITLSFREVISNVVWNFQNWLSSFFNRSK